MFINAFIAFHLKHFAVDPVSVLGDIGVDAGIVCLRAALSPGGGANDLVVVFGRPAGIALAGVFASCRRAKHARQNLPVVAIARVAIRHRHNIHIHAMQLVRVA